MVNTSRACLLEIHNTPRREKLIWSWENTKSHPTLLNSQPNQAKTCLLYKKHARQETRTHLILNPQTHQDFDWLFPIYQHSLDFIQLRDSLTISLPPHLSKSTCTFLSALDQYIVVSERSLPFLKIWPTVNYYNLNIWILKIQTLASHKMHKSLKLQR